MRVLGIIASPRKLGNSEICVKEIFKQLPAKWDKKIINLSQLHIEPCKACYACLPEGNSCVLDDDLELFLRQLQWAQRVVIAAPVYFLGEQTSVKLLTDRLISTLNETVTYCITKPCVIAVPHAINNWEGYGREAMLNFAHFLRLRVLDIRVLNKMLPGDVVDEDGLTQLHQLAEALTTNTERNWKDKNIICCPHCHSSLLQVHKDMTWHCVMCGESGDIVDWFGEMTALDPNREVREFRYNPGGLNHHGETLLNVNAEFRKRRREVIEHLKPYK